jgi:hypothetical protein
MKLQRLGRNEDMAIQTKTVLLMRTRLEGNKLPI